MSKTAHLSVESSATQVDRMLRMSKPELDQLFRESPMGQIPAGRGRGTVIVFSGTVLARFLAWLAYLLAWRGKVFNKESRDLLNIMSPFGIRAIRATVYEDSSWVDGRECIVLDYSKTSRVAHWIRDEIREAAPGIYLGQVFWSKKKLIKFALAFPR
jgi:hypothetical protein